MKVSFWHCYKTCCNKQHWKHRKYWTLDVWSGCLDSELFDFGLFDSGRLDLWTLDDSGLIELGRLYAWTLDNWTLELWTLGARKFFPFLVTSISFLLLVNVQPLIILSTIRLMYYDSGAELIVINRTCYNWYYNSNSLTTQQVGNWP